MNVENCGLSQGSISWKRFCACCTLATETETRLRRLYGCDSLDVVEKEARDFYASAKHNNKRNSTKGKNEQCEGVEQRGRWKEQADKRRIVRLSRGHATPYLW